MNTKYRFYCPMCGLAQEGKANKQVIENNMGSHVAYKASTICPCGFKSLIRFYPYEGEKK